MRSARHPHPFALSQRSVRLTGLLAGLTTALLASAPAGAVVVTPGGSYTQSVQATTAFQIIDNHGATSSAGVPQGVIRDDAGTRAVEAPAIDTGPLRGGVPDIGVAAQVHHHATARFQAVPDRRVDAKAAALASADTGRLLASAQARVVAQTRSWPDPASFEMVMGLASARAVLVGSYELTVSRALAEAIAGGTATAPLTASVTLTGNIERAHPSSGALTTDSGQPEVTLDILGFGRYADATSHRRQSITIDTDGAFSETVLATAGRIALDRYGPFGSPGLDCLEAAGVAGMGWVPCTVSGGFELELRASGNWGLADAQVSAEWSVLPGVVALRGSVANWGETLDARLLAPIPEPGGGILFGVGLGVVMVVRSRKGGQR